MIQSEPIHSLDDDEVLLIEEDAGLAAPANGAEKPWKVLIVDDDADVHNATELALSGLMVEGRPLLLLHAFSGAQAREIVEATEDLAVILLDVVMEAEDAGLRLVVHVRDVLRRSALRIILRTGQPGYAPELDTIRNYDINDYKTKSELTRVRLFTSLTSAVRSYRQMRSHEEMRRGLETVVQASTALTKLHGMQLFAQGVISQLSALLNVEPDGLICAQAGLEEGSEPARVIAASGQFSHLIQQPLSELNLPAVQQALQQCLNERSSRYEAPPRHGRLC
jgi:PleD family two-component response regulator